ncbi:hypothetical protein [Providencia alcalifaciens]|uniref:hypothetical protein n=1 Tax=Providencia alcalifaciens TaxID=126385 RepID=UPI003D2E21BE
MTVSTEISSNEYTGNGVTTDFDYKFRIFKANQLSVITSDADGDNVVTLRLGTDYTVTGANKSAGGKVILTRPLANGHKISVARDIPITQETSFRNQSKFFAETHEDAFDYLTMIIQRIWGTLGSLYLKRPNILANWFDAKGYRIANLGKPKRDGDAVDFGTMKDAISSQSKRSLRVDDMDIAALPKASDRAGNVLTFDRDGRPVVVAPASGSAVDVLNKLGMDDGSKLIGYKKPYEGAVHRTAADYFNQEINIDDFGAKGDALLINGDKNQNRTDDSAAIQNALVAAYRAGGVKVTATPWKSYYVANKIFTLATGHTPGTAEQNSFPTRRIQVIDFQGARFIGRDDIADDSNVFIESGYIKQDGTIVSVFGEPPETHLTYGTTLGNMELVNFKRGFRFRNHIYGCKLHDVMGVNVQQIAYTERCFVKGWNNVHATGSHTNGLYRYHFRDNSNIMPLTTVTCGDHDVGMLFEGATEAVKLFNCGIENYKTHGIRLSGAFYNLELDSCYVESHSGVGITGNQIKSITINNSWFFGDMTIFGDIGENTNIRWMPNNIVHSSTKMWDLSKVSEYNLSDITLENSLHDATKNLPLANAKIAMNVEQTLTAYNPAVGVTNSGVVGKVTQCSGLQKIMVNGRTGKGVNSNITVGCIITTEPVTETSSKAVYKTGITYNDTQLIYVNITVNHASGVWKWSGLIIGDSVFKMQGSDSDNISITNENGLLVVRSRTLSGTVITPRGGEIRII